MKLIDKAIAYTIGACVVAIPTLVVWLLLAGPLASQGRTVPVRSNIIFSENAAGQMLYTRVVTPIWPTDLPMDAVDAEIRQRRAIIAHMNDLAEDGWSSWVPN
jgi:hypothetical protein